MYFAMLYSACERCRWAMGSVGEAATAAEAFSGVCLSYDSETQTAVSGPKKWGGKGGELSGARRGRRTCMTGIFSPVFCSIKRTISFYLSVSDHVNTF